MWPYFAVLSILAVLSLAEARDREPAHYGFIAALIVALFSAMRFETGYDWLSYDAYFRRSRELFDDPQLIINFILGRDIGFALLTVIVKSLTSNVQVLFIGISLATVAAQHFVLSSLTKRTAVIWLAYFGLLFISAQMTLLRQNIASVIVLFGLLLTVRGRVWAGTGFAALAATFHIAAAPFAALPLISKRRPHPFFSIAVLAIGAIVLASGLNLLPQILLTIEPLTPSGIAARLQHYAANAAPPALSLSGMAIMAVHAALLVLLYLLPSREERNDPAIRIALWLLLGQISAQLYLAGATDIWARTMIVVTPWSLASLLRLSLVSSMKVQLRAVCAAAITMGAAGTLGYYLTSSGASPLVPYHSLLQVSFGHYGDGRQRAIDAWVSNHPNRKEVEQTLRMYEWYGVYPWKPPIRRERRLSTQQFRRGTPSPQRTEVKSAAGDEGVAVATSLVLLRAWEAPWTLSFLASLRT
ncbi:MAG: hypothetical protein CML24_03325 [Rhizobiales bacterium]|nr:hypothetical protein [Hyphomicrobiales bacterium]|tara:strand:- start:4007 stop:5419 length:1413 start_codon:yes stop_codon:yes gene_type:complete